MKSYSTVEWCGILLGATLFLGGLAEMIWPQSGLVPHLTGNAIGTQAATDMDVMTPTKARLCGVLAIVIGSAITGLATYRQKE